MKKKKKTKFRLPRGLKATKPKVNRWNKRKDPLWDLERDGITYTMLSRWLICRERFRLSSVEGWTPDSINLPIEFGSAFHECLEAAAKNREILTDTKIRRIVQAYYKRREQRQLTDDQIADLQKCLGMVEVMFRLYQRHWNDVPTFTTTTTEEVNYYDRDFRYVSHEEAFDVIHPLPSGRMIRLRGRWDGAFIHPIDGQLVLQENKTKGQIDEEGLQAGLHKDFQTLFYLHTLGLGGKGIATSVLYNVVRRPLLKPRVKETLQQFVSRIQDDVCNRPQHYYMRWVVSLTQEELSQWVTRSLNPILESVVRWWDSIKHNPFDPWTTPNHGSGMLVPNVEHWERPTGVYDADQFSARGDFWEPVVLGVFRNYYQREVCFPELED